MYVFPAGPDGVCHPLNLDAFNIYHPSCDELYNTPHRTWAMFEGWEYEVMAHAQLARQGSNCTSVQECGMAALLLSLGQLLSPGYYRKSRVDDAFRNHLFEQMVRRAKRYQSQHLSQLLKTNFQDLSSEHLSTTADVGSFTKRPRIKASSVTLGMHADPASASGPWRGQIRLWQGYAAAHGLTWLLDTEQYFDGEVFAKWADLFWASESAARIGFWKKYEWLTPGPSEEVPLASWSWADLRDPLFLKSIAVFNQPPMMWDSLEALAAAVPKNVWTIWIDFDLTISPCCFDDFSFVELIDGWEDGMRNDLLPHVIIRDSPREDYHHHCANAGFVIVRNTAIGRLYVELARQKRRWPVLPYGYQGALAEAVLELLGLEHAVKGPPGTPPAYLSTCLRHLIFGSADGVLSYANYCHCWKMELERLAGPVTSRGKSTWVRFLNPRVGPETGLLLASLFIFRSGANNKSGSWLPSNNRVRGFGYLPLQTWGRDQHRSYVDAWLPPAFELGGPCGVLPLVIHWASLPWRPRLIYEFLNSRFPQQMPMHILANGTVGEIVAAYRAAAGAGRAILEKQPNKVLRATRAMAIGGPRTSKRWHRSVCNIGSARMWAFGGFSERGRSTNPFGPHR